MILVYISLKISSNYQSFVGNSFNNATLLTALGLCILRAHSSSNVMLIKSVTDLGENVLTYNSGPRRVGISAQTGYGI